MLHTLACTLGVCLPMKHDPLGHCDYTVLSLRQSGELCEHSIVRVRHVDGFPVLVCRFTAESVEELWLNSTTTGREIKDSAGVGCCTVDGGWWIALANRLKRVLIALVPGGLLYSLGLWQLFTQFRVEISSTVADANTKELGKAHKQVLSLAICDVGFPRNALKILLPQESSCN
jgi:hypothetical protein